MEAFAVAPGCAHPAALCGRLDPPIEAAWQIAREHRVVVVVTLGANGAAVALPVVVSSKLGFIAGAEVRRFGVAPLRANESVIDTAGAGDAFVGAFGAFHVTLVPVRSRSRGARRSLRTFPGGRSFLSAQGPSVSGFQPTPNLDAFRRRPEITSPSSRQPRLSRAATTSIRA